MAPSSARTLGAFSAGASVSSRICSASSIRPRPMATRPRSLMRLRRAAAERHEADDEQHRRGGRDVERQHLHDQRRADVGAEHDGERRARGRPAFGGERGGHQRRSRCCSAAARSGPGRRRRRRSGCRAPSTGSGAGRSRTRAGCRSGPCAGPTAAARRRPSGREGLWIHDPSAHLKVVPAGSQGAGLSQKWCPDRKRSLRVASMINTPSNAGPSRNLHPRQP